MRAIDHREGMPLGQIYNQDPVRQSDRRDHQLPETAMLQDRQVHRIGIESNFKILLVMLPPSDLAG